MSAVPARQRGSRKGIPNLHTLRVAPAPPQSHRRLDYKPEGRYWESGSYDGPAVDPDAERIAGYKERFMRNMADWIAGLQ